MPVQERKERGPQPRGMQKQNQIYDYRGIVIILTTRQEEHVLDETSKHMPRFEVHKRAEEVEPYKHIHVINKDL